eukprot:848873-Amphidinium_carterae.1
MPAPGAQRMKAGNHTLAITDQPRPWQWPEAPHDRRTALGGTARHFHQCPCRSQPTTANAFLAPSLGSCKYSISRSGVGQEAAASAHFEKAVRSFTACVGSNLISVMPQRSISNESNLKPYLLRKLIRKPKQRWIFGGLDCIFVGTACLCCRMLHMPLTRIQPFRKLIFCL